MKKYIYKLFLFLLILGLNSSCTNEWLNLEPDNEKESTKAITNFKELDVAKVGLYDGLQGSSSRTQYYAARFIYYGDVRAEDMQAESSGKRSYSTYAMNYTQDDAPSIWLVPYNVIRRANNIILAIDEEKVKDGTEEQIRDIYAQAKVARALAHFDLVRVYGLPYTYNTGSSLGVPILLKPTSAESMPGRNTVAEVYTQVIKDLTEAIDSNYLSKVKTTGYFNIWVAKSLLARVYLYKGDYSNALSTAKDIIENSPYSLWSNDEYVQAWTKQGSSEMIMELINYNNTDWSDREFIGYLYNEEGYADIIATKSFLEMIQKDPNDVRNKIFVASKKQTYIKKYGTDPVFINKFPGREEESDFRINNIPLIRLSEIYLIAAEAAFRENDLTSAVNYLQKIAKRANPATTEIFNSSTITLDRIITEKRKELVGEGHRFFDAMRNGEEIVRYTDVNDRGYHPILPNKLSNKFDRTYFRAILPIPLKEINANSIIRNQQNSGY